MKRRGKRLAFTVAATGLAVLIGVGVLYRDAVRDHVEAWRFQLTRKTLTIEPDHIRDNNVAEMFLLHTVASSLNRPVIFWPQQVSFGAMGIGLDQEILRAGGDFRKVLEARGWRVLEQRFPRRAYVVIRDPLSRREVTWQPEGISLEAVPQDAKEATPAE